MAIRVQNHMGEEGQKINFFNLAPDLLFLSERCPLTNTYILSRGSTIYALPGPWKRRVEIHVGVRLMWVTVMYAWNTRSRRRRIACTRLTIPFVERGKNQKVETCLIKKFVFSRVNKIIIGNFVKRNSGYQRAEVNIFVARTLDFQLLSWKARN